jgi:hypothetical protein
MRTEPPAHTRASTPRCLWLCVEQTRSRLQCWERIALSVTTLEVDWVVSYNVPDTDRATEMQRLGLDPTRRTGPVCLPHVSQQSARARAFFDARVLVVVSVAVCARARVCEGSVIFIGCIFFGGFGSSVLLPRIVKIFADSASADGSNLLNLIVICGMNKQASAAAMLRTRACVRARARVCLPHRFDGSQERTFTRRCAPVSCGQSTRSRGPRREGSPAVAWIPR